MRYTLVAVLAYFAHTHGDAQAWLVLEVHQQLLFGVVDHRVRHDVHEDLLVVALLQELDHEGSLGLNHETSLAVQILLDGRQQFQVFF